MNKYFINHNPEKHFSIPGYTCTKGQKTDGLSWLRIYKDSYFKDGFDYPPKHIITVYSDGSIQNGGDFQNG